MVDDNFVFNTLITELQKPMYRYTLNSPYPIPSLSSALIFLTPYYFNNHNRDGVVIDGFPRTTVQAEFVSKFYQSSVGLSILPVPCIFPFAPLFTYLFQRITSRILFVTLHVDEALSASNSSRISFID